MNYIAHLNGFRERRKIEPLTTNELALYFIIMEYCNEISWKEWFTVTNGVLQGLSGLSRSAFQRARGDLTRKGYIKYREGSGNQCGRYLIVDFGTQSGTQLGTQNEHNQERSQGTLDKPKTETKEEIILPKNPPIPYEKICAEYNRICVSFPKCTKLSGKRKEAIAARIHSGYLFDDFVKLFEIAQASDFLKGKNKNNWRADFDWLICDSNMAKALDGRYENRTQRDTMPPPQEQSTGNPFLDKLKREGKL